MARVCLLVTMRRGVGWGGGGDGGGGDDDGNSGNGWCDGSDDGGNSHGGGGNSVGGGDGVHEVPGPLDFRVANPQRFCNPLMLVGPTVLGGSVKACSCLIERRANFGNTN